VVGKARVVHRLQRHAAGQRDATIDYEISRLPEATLHAASGTIAWQAPAMPAPPPTAAIPMPVLPLVNARVDELSLRLKIGQDNVALVGPFTLDLDPAQGVHVRLDARPEALDVKFHADGQRIDAVLGAQGDAPLLDAIVTDPLGLATRVELKADLARLRTWAAQETGLPAAWREMLRDAELTSGNLHAAAQYLLDGDTWRVDDFALQWSGMRASSIASSGTLRASATPEAGQWNIKVLEPAAIDVSHEQEGAALGARVAVDPETAVTVSTDGAIAGKGAVRVDLNETNLPAARITIDGWKYDANEANVHARDLGVTNPALRAAELTLNAQAGAAGWGDARGEMSLAGIHPDISAITPELIVKADWRLEEAQRATARFSARLDGQDAANGTVDWNNATGQGRVDAQWSTDAGALIAWARALYRPLEAVGAERGTLAGKADFTWRGGALAGIADVRLKDLAARYEEARVDDANLAIRITDLARPAYTFDVRIPTATAATGLPVTGLVLTGSASGSRITVKEGGFGVWGGNLSLRPGTFDVKKDGHVVLDVANLDLEQVFRFVDVAGLSGSGRLNGAVPLLVQTDGVAIDEAKLDSLGGGTLRYVSAAPAAASNIALQALSDFRYQALNTGIGYRRDGTYTISARLRGSNPALYNGYPIAFNINLQGQLPGLLRSTLLTGNFDREVMKQVQLDAGAPNPVQAPDKRPPATGK